jgi:hypothetical protein
MKAKPNPEAATSVADTDNACIKNPTMLNNGKTGEECCSAVGESSDCGIVIDICFLGSN